MILGEKPAALTGPDHSKSSSAGLPGKAGLPSKAGQYSSDIYSFSEVVDSACERLMDRQIKYSIRRIREMEERLCCLERELDDFLFQKDRKLG